jgi:hypothetical protein
MAGITVGAVLKEEKQIEESESGENELGLIY